MRTLLLPMCLAVAACSGATGPAVPSFSTDLQPILSEKCVKCHQAGGIGLFRLDDYAQAKAHAGAIADAVEAGRMPPFYATHDGTCGDFRAAEAAVRAGALDGLLVGSLASWVDDAANGIVVGGLLTKTGPLFGIGVAGAVLVSAGDVTGATVAPVGITTGNAQGIHLGVGLIAGGNLTGAQLAVIGIAAGSVRGAQLSVSSYAGEITGAQASVLNVVGGPVRGAQVGVLNIGGDVVGTQIGVINIAGKVRGLQLGVVNIAETSVPVGLINVITRGRYSLAAWTNETSVANLAVKIGTDAVYSFVVGGVNPRGVNAKPTLSIGLGLGVRLRFDSWYGEAEASFVDSHQTGGNFITTAAFSPTFRINVGYQWFEKVAVFGGPQLAVLLAVNGTDGRTLSPWGFDVSARTRLVPGFALGAQFL